MSLPVATTSAERQPSHGETGTFLVTPLLANPKACQHASVDFGKPELLDGQTIVEMVCLGCGARWQSVKLVNVRA